MYVRIWEDADNTVWAANIEELRFVPSPASFIPLAYPNEPVDADEPLIFTASGNKTLSPSASVLKSVSPSLSLIWKSIWFPPLLMVKRCGWASFLCAPKKLIPPASSWTLSSVKLNLVLESSLCEIYCETINSSFYFGNNFTLPPDFT